MSAGPPAPTPPSVSGVKSMNCPNCGAALTVRTFQNAVTVACSHCHSILDAKDPKLQILQKFEVARGEDEPLIPLGTRGTIRGVQYEVVGFERRTIHVDGAPYSWHEYLLFNPYKGFRYLTEYNGHWNDVSVLKSLPTVNDTEPPSVTYLGEKFKHFQTAQASTSFVLGEFPWQVRVGETADVTDYVHPPRVLSSEKMHREVTWSMGEYMSGHDVWKAFGLAGDPPQPVGVYENQPSPLAANVVSIWSLFAIFVLVLLVVAMLVSTFTQRKVVFEGTYQFTPTITGEPSFVTDPFELPGRTSDVEVRTVANVSNSWIYLNYALINQDSGQAYDFGREVSYYYGYDSDGRWSEGGTSDTVVVPTVPAGNYYLRIEPESQTGGMRTTVYRVIVTRDVPVNSLYLFALLALLIPAAAITWRSISFEHQRWAESDYAPSGDDE